MKIKKVKASLRLVRRRRKMETESVNVRVRGKKETETLKAADFIGKIKKEIAEKK